VQSEKGGKGLQLLAVLVGGVESEVGAPARHHQQRAMARCILPGHAVEREAGGGIVPHLDRLLDDDERTGPVLRGPDDLITAWIGGHAQGKENKGEDGEGDLPWHGSPPE
jgi:hypothetical protein